LLMIAVGLSLLLILGCYRDPRAPSRVFVIFLMLSTLTATQYCYIFYAPVFLIACAQMRIFNGRTLTAALLGLVAPWWIMLGFGIISPDSIHLPHLTSIFSEADNEDAVMLLATAAVTALLFLTSLTLNLMKAIAYNAMARAINGVITVTALATIAAMAADYRNIIVYIPVLDFCAALQTAHYFSAHRADRSFIAIILILVIYVALFACQIIM
ncbi:MAG: hypothetical protein K2F79_04460, partial [Muribaculaceae bacterium]|nr:hypothetical protein [Muribaculaceae bacterium]